MPQPNASSALVQSLLWRNCLSETRGQQSGTAKRDVFGNADTFSLRNRSTMVPTEDSFPSKDVNHLVQYDEAPSASCALSRRARTDLQRCRIHKLSSIIFNTKATSPPGVIISTSDPVHT